MNDPLRLPEAEWRRVARALQDALPSYERMNRLMSLGQVGRWREAAAAKCRAGELVLEIGSGPGVFAPLLLARGARIVLLDPLRAMQEAARRGVKGAAFALGIGERLPLAAGSVDRVFCLFSFRDFLDKRLGVREMLRVLKPGGEAHVLEPAKGRGPRQWLVNAHVNLLVPAAARLLVPPRVQRGWQGNPYRAFARTYRAFGTPQEYAALMDEEGFRGVRVERLALGGAFLLSGRA